MKSLKMYLCLIAVAFVSIMKAGGGNPQDMLQAAILNDSAEEIKKAISLGADVNGKLSDKQTPLSAAYSLKQKNALQALLDMGAKPDEALVQKALTARDFSNALLFLQKGAEIKDRSLGSFMFSCVRFLSPLNQRSSSKSRDALILDVMQQLINRGYPVNNIWTLESSGSMMGGVDATPINFYQNDEAVKLFLKNGANPNFITSNCTPLLRVISFSRSSGNNEVLSIVKTLLDAGANINQKGIPSSEYKTPLTPTALAQKQNNWPLQKFLTDNGGVV
jgi:ankyrin repeat protein